MVKIHRLLRIMVVVILLSGCATTGKAYNFVKTKKFKDGYVVNRKGVIIPEYTIGENNQAPEDLDLAKERFRRRKPTVDKYYKQMGVIVDSNIEIGKTMAGMATVPFKLPFKIVDYNRYQNDPEYRKKVDDEEEKAEQVEAERIEKLKKELNEWVIEDLKNEAETGE